MNILIEIEFFNNENVEKVVSLKNHEIESIKLNAKNGDYFNYS